MISDTLSDAVAKIDDYLADPIFNEVYKGKMRHRISFVRDIMNHLRHDMDVQNLALNKEDS